MTFFLYSYQDHDRGMGFTEPSAWISEATHQTVFTERLFPILQLQIKGSKGDDLKTLFLITFCI